MRRLLLLSLSGLLACAHTAPVNTTPSEPAGGARRTSADEPTQRPEHKVSGPRAKIAPAPPPEVTYAINQAWKESSTGAHAQAVERLKQTWAQGHRFPEVAWYAALEAARAGDTGASFTWVELAVRHGFTDPGGMLKARSLEPVRARPGYDALVAQARKNAREARSEAGVGSGLETVSAREAGLSEPALEALVKAAEETGSAALVVMHQDRLVGEWYFGGDSHLIESMSATKSVVSMAIGMLLEEGKIASIDLPVSTWFPEWKDGRKGQVTLRHLLSHTSGLDTGSSSTRLYDAKDLVRHALDSEVVAPPGSRFQYNNNAVNLLPGIIERASGQKADAYVKRRLIQPLGIRDFRWDKDPSGNPVGMAGFQIHPLDFARLGQVMLQQGVYRDQTFMSRDWVRKSTAATHPDAPTSGLLWWRLYEKPPTMTLVQPMLDEAHAKGFPKTKLKRLQDMVDKPMPQDELGAALIERLGSPEELTAFESKVRNARYALKQEGEVMGFAAMGSGGQKLLIFPKHQLVVVRMADLDERVSPGTMAFSHIVPLVLDLVRPAPGASRP
ncbi:beta-lactamase family protein [Myxococcus sp. K38C18041901]|uniref:serine hydrolase domain-containing protein n=1 Tax=Myxococcus guangdongensis TaxID=2906760 RepID=UPI0020A75581|nr:serine hydrolase [Myxococcus guangdongensis]MCP3057737.1 beta-lactamase family protein [Myxococcus guangdongensis]